MASGVDNTDDMKIATAFSQLANGSDKIDIRHLEGLLRRFGYDPTEDDMDHIFAIYDPSNTGEIEFEPYNHLMLNFKNEIKAKEMRRAFRAFDEEGVGYIKERELRHVVCSMFKHSEEDVQEILHTIEVSANGFYNYENVIDFCLQKN